MWRGLATALALCPLALAASARAPAARGSAALAQDFQGEPAACLLQVDANRRHTPGAPAGAGERPTEANEPPAAAVGQGSGPVRPSRGSARKPSSASSWMHEELDLLQLPGLGGGPDAPKELDLLQLPGLGGGPDAPKDHMPKKSKVVLMILEMVPLAGPLGLDRFYLGDTATGIAKLVVCVCTCFIGGFIWGLLDAIVVIVNCISRKQSIDTLGMTAQFTHDDIETAHTLAIIGLVIQLFCFCTSPRLLAVIRARLLSKGRPAAEAALSQAGAADGGSQK